MTTHRVGYFVGSLAPAKAFKQGLEGSLALLFVFLERLMAAFQKYLDKQLG